MIKSLITGTNVLVCGMCLVQSGSCVLKGGVISMSKYLRVEADEVIKDLMKDYELDKDAAHDKYIDEYMTQSSEIHIEVGRKHDSLGLFVKDGQYIVQGHYNDAFEDYFYNLDKDKESLEEVMLEELVELVKKQYDLDDDEFEQLFDERKKILLEELNRFLMEVE